MTLTQFFTFSRHRRLRSTLFLRDLVRENSLSCNDLIYPLFAAAQNGWINEKNTVLESMISMKRAGADLIVTYFAKDIARYLLEDNR
ncbi:hypothetical protein AXI59_17910 [Bacillus nakamurai]|nr:hypothetical protein AXI59_17910 [Bacillus nakamurai]